MTTPETFEQWIEHTVYSPLLSLEHDALNELWDEREKMREACLAALKYDDSIAGRAIRGEYDLAGEGGMASGEDLDSLYHDWITKARAALEGASK